MAILKIARMGHPVLRQPAQAVSDPRDPETLRLIANMVETMIDSDGIGLAAPQVHVAKRVVVYRMPRERAEEEGETLEVPVTALINPALDPIGDARTYGWERCLSVPDMTGAVLRHDAVRCRALDIEGAPLDFTAEGFHARVLQHEIDHLDGILYPMRMTDLSLLAFDREWNAELKDLDLTTLPLLEVAT
jgi:peptide deformylase